MKTRIAILVFAAALVPAAAAAAGVDTARPIIQRELTLDRLGEKFQGGGAYSPQRSLDRWRFEERIESERRGFYPPHADDAPALRLQEQRIDQQRRLFELQRDAQPQTR